MKTFHEANFQRSKVQSYEYFRIITDTWSSASPLNSSAPSSAVKYICMYHKSRSWSNFGFSGKFSMQQMCDRIATAAEHGSSDIMYLSLSLSVSVPISLSRRPPVMIIGLHTSLLFSHLLNNAVRSSAEARGRMDRKKERIKRNGEETSFVDYSTMIRAAAIRRVLPQLHGPTAVAHVCGPHGLPGIIWK